MQRILTVQQMVNCEKNSHNSGVSLSCLMDNAGQALGRFVLKACMSRSSRRCLILAGKGNNGGDGFVCADLLAHSGVDVTVMLVCGEASTELAKAAFAKLGPDVTVLPFSADSSLLSGFDVIVDCLFGTGFHGSLREDVCGILQIVNSTDALRIACDLPSGCDASNGLADKDSFKAHMTLTFHRKKAGMLLSPCRYFCGRDEELDELHNVIYEKSSVIITGIAGIGKSEFVRMYAQKHSADYPYFGYYFYKGSLKSIIADVIDDPIVSDIDTRYNKNLKLLSKLGENVLLIIDNFNTAVEDDECIYDLLDLKCKVIFTSHMNYDDLCTYELKGFRSTDSSFELISKFYQYQNDDIPHLTAIFDAVDNHIFCVELCARLLKKGFYTPETLAEKIVGGALKGIMERFSASKDKRQKKKTYYDHIRDLFDLLKLHESYRETLMMMIVAPDKGIRKDFFAKLIELKDLNILEDLVEFGLIYEYKNGTVTVHSVIRSLIRNEYTPSFENCGKLVESIRSVCLNEAVTGEVDSSVFQDVILLAIKYISFDSIDENFCFVSDCMKYCDRFGVDHYCEAIIKWEEQHHENDKSRKEILYWNDLAYYKTLQNKVGYAFKSYKKAIECFDNCNDTVLKANILSNYGALLNSENRIDEAAKYIKEAVDLFAQLDESKEFLFDKYRTIINYANIILGYGKVSESIALITAAEKKLREYGLQGTDVYAKCLISDCFCKLCIGDRSAAVSLYKGLTLMIRLYGKDSHYVNDVVGSIQPFLPLLLRYSPLKELLSC